MNTRLVFNLLGRALGIEGVLMLPSVVVALLYGGTDWKALLVSAGLVSAVGVLLLKAVHPKSDNLRPREALTAVALIWICFSFFGGLPFYFHGAMDTLTDCFFETASGFTTTGASILTNVEALPRGLLFWRSFTHWVGGMGVLVLSLALLPNMGGRSSYLLQAESTGPAPGKLVPRIGKSAKLLYQLYLGLSVAMVIALLLCGLDLYDSLIHMFGTAGTGGFSNYGASVGHFNSPAVEIVIATFLILYGVNFSLYYLLLFGRWKEAIRNEELRVYLSVIAVSVVIIAINITPQVGSWVEALRQSYFQVCSIITTAGFVTANFDLWPQLSRVILVVLMLLGACAGSTGGGIKMVRVTLLFKAMGRELRRMVHPRSVLTLKMDGKAVEEDTIARVLVFVAVYIMVIFAAMLIVALDNFSFETTFTAVISAVSNIGPGLDMVGAIGNFSAFSHLSKWVLSICMLIGRLEIYPILMLFIPSVWRKN